MYKLHLFPFGCSRYFVLHLCAMLAKDVFGACGCSCTDHYHEHLPRMYGNEIHRWRLVLCRLKQIGFHFLFCVDQKGMHLVCILLGQCDHQAS